MIPSQVTVLTSVGLDHTEWLGDTSEEIAAEKLAVLRDSIDPGPRPGRARGRELAASTTAVDAGRELIVRRRTAGPRRRASRPLGAVSAAQLRPSRCALAEAFLGELDPAAVAGAARLASDSGPRSSWSPATRRDLSTPPTTPTGAAALAEALPGLAAGRPVVRLPGGARRQGRGGDRAALGAARSSTWSARPPTRGPAMGRPGAVALDRRRARRLASARPGSEAEAVPDAGRGRAGGRSSLRREPGAWRFSPVRTTFCGTHGSRSEIRTPLDDGPGGRRGRRRDPRLLRPRLPVRPHVPLTDQMVAFSQNGREGAWQPPSRLD